jgi:hypothetical protein
VFIFQNDAIRPFGLIFFVGSFSQHVLILLKDSIALGVFISHFGSLSTDDLISLFDSLSFTVLID